jgi:hypothetical protein
MNFYVFIMKIITESGRRPVSSPTPRADGLGPLVKRLVCVLERLEELLDGRRTAEGMGRGVAGARRRGARFRKAYGLGRAVGRQIAPVKTAAHPSIGLVE